MPSAPRLVRAGACSFFQSRLSLLHKQSCDRQLEAPPLPPPRKSGGIKTPRFILLPALYFSYFLRGGRTSSPLFVSSWSHFFRRGLMTAPRSPAIASNRLDSTFGK